jgi:hypothetical protein
MSVPASRIRCCPACFVFSSIYTVQLYIFPPRGSRLPISGCAKACSNYSFSHLFSRERYQYPLSRSPTKAPVTFIICQPLSFSKQEDKEEDKAEFSSLSSASATQVPLPFSLPLSRARDRSRFISLSSASAKQVRSSLIKIGRLSLSRQGAR